ncbi:hypothetical protein ACFFRR_006168 [Megaselia abdita]
MPYGFPEINVGPLAPAVISEKTFQLEHHSIGIEGEIYDGIILGLNGFEVSDIKNSFILSKFKAIFEWQENIKIVLNNYILSAFAGDSYYKLGEGPFNLVLYGLKMNVSAKYSLLTGNMKIRDLNVQVSLKDCTCYISGLFGHGTVNQNLNQYLGKLILYGINENQETISKILREFLTPIINNYFNNNGGIFGNGETIPKWDPTNQPTEQPRSDRPTQTPDPTPEPEPDSES